MRLHLHGERHVRQMRDAVELRRHLGVIGLDEVGHVALAELAGFQNDRELFGGFHPWHILTYFFAVVPDPFPLTPFPIKSSECVHQGA